MKKFTCKYFLLIALTGAISCEENEIPQINDVNGITLAQFARTSAVLPTPEEGASTQVDVILTTISDTARNIEVSVDPESTAGEDQYEISNLVVPANSYRGTIRISSSYDALPETGSSKLILNLTGIENSETLIENGQLNVEMFRTCPIVPEEFVGSWTGTTAWDYNTEVVTFLNDDGELMMNGLSFGWFQDWWGEVIVANEPVKVEIDPETGMITIPEQYYLSSTWNGDPQPDYNLKATGMVLNPCTRTIEISPVLVQDGTAIDGSAYGPAFKEVITLVE